MRIERKNTACRMIASHKRLFMWSSAPQTCAAFPCRHLLCRWTQLGRSSAPSGKCMHHTLLRSGTDFRNCWYSALPDKVHTSAPCLRQAMSKAFHEPVFLAAGGAAMTITRCRTASSPACAATSCAATQRGASSLPLSSAHSARPMNSLHVC